ncbi:transmembrane proteins 14C-domain-containing protein [Fimicolochytrium jonesii]|uniref:transmembrane proteins 14C-domain-containing protein n=1 Tax=Fimicolochytrium jonesii TaxID=1396493 RepID=UPI0022FF0926|nr:transmembrane proteins 14C-domain-containing protein [Fimicolochytrium jonesii]KAI8819674.1 transmembrane proteins 14C-domain-containing protein [Fimicolochytrium jonesii]
MPLRKPSALSSKEPDYFAYAYAGIVFIGGVIGFVRAGSLVSLLFGTFSGTLLGIGARQVSANGKNFQLLLGISATLLLIMGMRFANSGKFMPAGLVALISGVSCFRYGLRLSTML